jgi:LPPG:FO 2-phospho-L-lactate transferase
MRDPPTSLDLPHARADTLMKTLEDRIRVARAALELAAAVRSGTPPMRIP